jgi:hypothetical protein
MINCVCFAVFNPDDGGTDPLIFGIGPGMGDDDFVVLQLYIHILPGIETAILQPLTGKAYLGENNIMVLRPWERLGLHFEAAYFGFGCFHKRIFIRQTKTIGGDYKSEQTDRTADIKGYLAVIYLPL